MCRGGTWLRFECAVARTEDECATIVPAIRGFPRFYLSNLSNKILTRNQGFMAHLINLSIYLSISFAKSITNNQSKLSIYQIRSLLSCDLSIASAKVYPLPHLSIYLSIYLSHVLKCIRSRIRSRICSCIRSRIRSIYLSHVLKCIRSRIRSRIRSCIRSRIYLSIYHMPIHHMTIGADARADR